MRKRRAKADIYRDWKPTDSNVRAVAEDPTAFSIMRALAREVLALREAARHLGHPAYVHEEGSDGATCVHCGGRLDHFDDDEPCPVRIARKRKS